MLKIFESYKDLKGCTLKEGDILIFRKLDHPTLTYKVMANYLACGVMNSQVFKLAGIPYDDRYEFCSEAYGYSAKGGDFPVCKHDDYEALTRVALALFEAIEKADSPQHFTSLKQLVTRGELCEDDTFELCGLRYAVENDYFENMGVGSNSKLLRLLNIQDEDLDKIYGYKHSGGDWPQWESSDFKAAYRTLCYMFMLAEAKAVNEKSYDGSAEQKEDARYVIIELKKKQQALRKQRDHINIEVGKMREQITSLQNEISALLKERTALANSNDALDDEISALKEILEDC
jgi:hypothetical protein